MACGAKGTNRISSKNLRIGANLHAVNLATRFSLEQPLIT
jgi:hypothetical protein